MKILQLQLRPFTLTTGPLTERTQVPVSSNNRKGLSLTIKVPPCCWLNSPHQNHTCTVVHSPWHYRKLTNKVDSLWKPRIRPCGTERHVTRAKDNSLKKYENFLCNELNIKMKNKRKGCLLLDYSLVKQVQPPGRPLHNTIISFVKTLFPKFLLLFGNQLKYSGWWRRKKRKKKIFLYIKTNGTYFQSWQMINVLREVIGILVILSTEGCMYSNNLYKENKLLQIWAKYTSLQ